MPSSSPKPRRTAKGWTPAAGLRVEVFVARGDVSFKAEATVGEALNVARLLVAMARQLAADAPDILPHADSVPGGVLPYWEDGDVDARTRLGFRP
jgi:hypothetical protein